MIRHAKRNMGIVSALFALLEGAILLVINGLMLVDKLLNKNFMDNIFTLNTTKYNKDFSLLKSKLPLINFALVFVGLFLVILAFKYLKKPINKEGKITYKKGTLFFEIVISLIMAIMALLGTMVLADYELVDIEKINLICYVIVGSGVFTVLFAVITFFIKTNVYNLKTVVKPAEKRKVDVSTLYANEKLQKIQQLNELGSISSKDYNDATAKYTQSV